MNKIGMSVGILLAVLAQGTRAETGAADPFLRYCEANQIAQYYDCQCLTELVPAMRAQLVEDYKASLYPMDQARLESQRQQLASMSDERRRANIERSMKQTEDTIAKQSDPAGIDASVLALRLPQSPDAVACKATAQVHESALFSCNSMSTSAKYAEKKGVSQAEYCGCVADTVVERWLADTKTYSSNWQVNASTQAHFSCQR